MVDRVHEDTYVHVPTRIRQLEQGYASELFTDWSPTSFQKKQTAVVCMMAIVEEAAKEAIQTQEQLRQQLRESEERYSLLEKSPAKQLIDQKLSQNLPLTEKESIITTLLKELQQEINSTKVQISQIQEEIDALQKQIHKHRDGANVLNRAWKDTQDVHTAEIVKAIDSELADITPERREEVRSEIEAKLLSRPTIAEAVARHEESVKKFNDKAPESEKIKVDPKIGSENVLKHMQGMQILLLPIFKRLQQENLLKVPESMGNLSKTKQWLYLMEKVIGGLLNENAEVIQQLSQGGDTYVKALGELFTEINNLQVKFEGLETKQTDLRKTLDGLQKLGEQVSTHLQVEKGPEIMPKEPALPHPKIPGG